MSIQSLRPKPNCLLCDKMLTCKNPGRGAGFSCDKFVVMSRQQATYVTSLFVDDDPRPVSSTQGRFGASIGNELTDDDENSLLSLVNSVLDDKSGSGLVARDIKIDDRDIPEHPNFLSWNTEPNGSGIRPFARQLWIGLKLFAEWCQECSADKKIMLNIDDCPKDMEIEEFGERVQLLDYGVCPCCGNTKLDLFDDNDLDPYQELVLCLGQRSGKSIMTSMFVAYVMHKLLKLQKPTEVYGVLSNTTLTATFVALTYDRAHKLLWSPIKDLMTDAPWYQSMHGLLDHYADKYGEEISVRNETFFHYKHRKLLIHPQGPSKRKLRGDTRIMAGTDELGWFPVGEASEDNEKMNGPEVYTALDRSLKTIRASARRLWKKGIVNVPTAYNFNMSSPSSVLDMIMKLVHTYEHSRVALALQKATWEMNPNLDRSDFVKEYAEDEVKAERDFGAQPPLIDNAFIDNQEAVVEAFNKGLNLVEYQYEFYKDKEGKTRQHATLTKVRELAACPPMVLNLDAGYTGNSFAITLGHRVPSMNPKATTRIRFPLMVDIIPRKGNRLNHSRIMRQIVRPIIETFNVQAVFADRWNSLLLLHELEDDYGIPCVQYSVRRPDFDLYKSYLENGNIGLPTLERSVTKSLDVADNYPHSFDFAPVSHLLLQTLTVKDAGRTVTKGNDLTDDIFRTNVLGTRWLLDDDWCKKNLKEVKRRSVAMLGAVGSRGAAMIYGQHQNAIMSKLGAISSKGTPLKNG